MAVVWKEIKEIETGVQRKRGWETQLDRAAIRCRAANLAEPMFPYAPLFNDDACRELVERDGPVQEVAAVEGPTAGGSAILGGKAAGVHGAAQ
jgi:hypothetical protein